MVLQVQINLNRMDALDVVAFALRELPLEHTFVVWNYQPNIRSSRILPKLDSPKQFLTRRFMKVESSQPEAGEMSK